VLAALLLAALLLATPARADDASRYAACMTQAQQAPEAALQAAIAWRIQNGGIPASHCQAMALIGLAQPARAAGVLDAAVEDMNRARPPQPALQGKLAAQAGNAWLLAGDAQRAFARLTQALDLLPVTSPDRIDALTDRARASVDLGKPDKAIEDLKAATDRAAERADLWLLLATAQRRTGDLAAAARSIETALGLDANSADALAERGVIRAGQGNVIGARADWAAATRLAPASEAGQRALANLAATAP